jgi:hypothetical protein
MEKLRDFGRRDRGHAAPAIGLAREEEEDSDSLSRPAKADQRPVFDWQAILLRYLPDPQASEHAIKRFSPR